MPKLNLTHKSPYTARQMYEIASDVESYPLFVPLCKAARIYEHNVDDSGLVHMRAELVVGYAKLSIREAFTSTVTANPQDLTVEARSSEGAVRHLYTLWKFSELEDGHSKIAYSVDFSMKSLPLQLLMSTVLDRAVEKIMAGFMRRADQLYGND